MQIGSEERFVLNNKKTIINKRKDGNWNIEIFEPIF